MLERIGAARIDDLWSAIPETVRVKGPLPLPAPLAEYEVTRRFEAWGAENADAGREWFGDRTRDTHDLWHVLTGYGRDEAGEAANLAFSYALMPFRGVALILFGIAVNVPPQGMSRVAWLRYLYRAWKRGRRSAWLPAVRYERLLERPLAEVRRTLRIPSARTVHPEGVIVATVYSAEPAGA